MHTSETEVVKHDYWDGFPTMAMFEEKDQRPDGSHGLVFDDFEIGAFYCGVVELQRWDCLGGNEGAQRYQGGLVVETGLISNEWGLKPGCIAYWRQLICGVVFNSGRMDRGKLAFQVTSL